MDFYKEHPCKGQACTALCTSAPSPPHSQQHFQVTSYGLRQTTGAPLGFLFPSFFGIFSKKKRKTKNKLKKKKKTRTFLRTMPQWKEHRPSILRPKFAKNLELGFLFCFVLFCLNQTTTSFTIFTRSNYSVPKHQTCTAHGPHGKAPSAGQPQMLP